MQRLAWSPGERRTRRWIRGHGPRLDFRGCAGAAACAPAARLRAATPAAAHARASGRAAVRRQRVDGALLTHASALRPRASHAGSAASKCSSSPRRSRASPTNLAHARSTRQRSTSRGPRPTGPEARASATRCGSSISSGHAERSGVARSCCSCPTAGIVVIRRCLREQIERLQRSCHRLIWLNPLIGTLDYAPLTRGLQAALPFVDDFLPARTLSNLADLALHLDTLPSRTHRHGYRRFLHV